MLRRRPDLSWPLLVLLFALFVISVRLPRHWELIARHELPRVPHETSRAAIVAANGDDGNRPVDYDRCAYSGTR